MCARCDRTNIPCVYETEANETRSQAIRRRHDELRASHQVVSSSLTWLRSQSSEIVAQCLQRVDHTEDAVQSFCSVVSAQRAQQPTTEMSPVNSIIAASPWLTSSQDVKISLDAPQSYPWLSLEDCIGAKNITDRDPSVQTPTRRTKSQGFIASMLTDLDVSFWTTAPIPDQIATALLDLYFQTEQPLYGFFDAGLFLRDLKSKKTAYCSSLLVTSVLLWTSVGTRRA